MFQIMRTCLLPFTCLLAVAVAQSEVPSVTVGKFPQEVAVKYTADDGLPSNDVRSVFVGTDGRIYAETTLGWAVLKKRHWSKVAVPGEDVLPDRIEDRLFSEIAGITNQIAHSEENRLVAATSKGLLEKTPSGFEPIVVMDSRSRQWAAEDVRGVAFDSDGQLWFAALAGVACQTADGWKFYTGPEGLPYNDFTCAAAGPDGVLWFGTRMGAVRFDGEAWAYRQGLRWLPDDRIRSIAVDEHGNAWFATSGGVGCIERQMMTLAEKADFYEEEMEKYIRRTPFGYVSEVGLDAPGDKSHINYSDSDNDGLWTAMYGAGECFAYAATGDPKAKDRAKRAFEALRFLQKVTQGCEYSPPQGYVARTILPADGPDPNQGRIERDRKERDEGDKLWKVYEPRWPLSADGKWFWKSDTSSDELDGHYFFYPLYYDLVADTEEEKERVRDVVRDLTNHLVDHGYNLVDHDGTPTRWGYYGPESLNHDPNWWSERGLKSLSMLSYLAVARHMTGDPVYGEHMQRLCKEHAYDTNAMIYKIHRGIGSGNQSDDEMAFMSYYNLLKYTTADEFSQDLTFSFYSAWANEQPEMNPFFNFAYATHGLDAEYTSPWSTTSIAPWKGWLEDSIQTLKNFPLDRCNWASKNSHRLDIMLLPRQQAVELTEENRPRYGYRVNGKVIPVENRHFNHWNSNPWSLDYGGDGRQLASGTVYLLPYYMGLYHGFITEK
jgi:sugar lactone lactonase YvrE